MPKRGEIPLEELAAMAGLEMATRLATATILKERRDILNLLCPSQSLNWIGEQHPAKVLRDRGIYILSPVENAVRGMRPRGKWANGLARLIFDSIASISSPAKS